MFACVRVASFKKAYQTHKNFVGVVLTLLTRKKLWRGKKENKFGEEMGLNSNCLHSITMIN